MAIIIDRIFFDMDGVLTDFHGASIALHNLTDIARDWPKGVWDFHKLAGMSGNAFFAPMEEDFHGHGILVPRPWNPLYDIADHGGTLAYVAVELDKYVVETYGGSVS